MGVGVGDADDADDADGVGGVEVHDARTSAPVNRIAPATPPRRAVDESLRGVDDTS